MRSHTQSEDPSRAKPAPHRAGRGFGLVELVVVLAVVSIVLTFAVLGVRRSVASMRVQNSMKQLASRVEAARIDAIRRHQSATVDFKTTTSYTITMDFNGNGDVKSRSYDLETGVAAVSSPDGDLPLFDFDWRGRTPQCATSVTLQGQSGNSSTLSVSSAGDVTIDSGISANLSAGTYAAVSQTGDVQSGAVVSGAGSAACADPCNGCAVCEDCAGQSTPPAGCVAFTVKPTAISIRRNFKSSAVFTVFVTPADTITVVQTDGRTNLEFTPSPTQDVAAGGSKVFTVKSKNNSTGYFPVKFISACNPSNSFAATVKVTN